MPPGNGNGRGMTFLLSQYGTLICRDRTHGRLVHKPIGTQPDDADPVDIGNLTAATRIGVAALVADTANALRIDIERGPLSGWTVVRATDGMAVMLERGGQRLKVSPDIGEANAQPDAADADSSFLAVDIADIAVLRDVLAARWLVGTGGETERPETPILAPGFELRFGAMAVDLRWNLPLNLGEWPHRLMLHREMWKLVRVFRYRPLVFFVAYGNANVLRQFGLNLTSLATVGEYDGEILAITDKTPTEIGAHLPPGKTISVALLPIEARDRIAFIAARYAIADWPAAAAFQPLLYVDADMLFDKPVAPMLYELARADRICAVPEPHSIADSPMVGSHLIAADGSRPDPGRKGFNSGTLGIPNMVRHGPGIALIGRALRNRLSLSGRQSNGLVDQPMANYVSYRTLHVDTALLGRYVRLSNASAPPADRIGLVHYCWVPDGAMRVEVMTSYLEGLHAMG